MRIITNENDLRQLIGEPTEVVQAKVAPRLNSLTRKFIEVSPFVCLATFNGAGDCDVSPRGDPAGFVKILSDQELFVPERPGNRLADTLRNILETGRIGMLFFIPGVGDTFRVNGGAKLVTDRDLLRACAVDGKLPKLGILVQIEEAYTQCSKAFLRSRLWDPSTQIERKSLPTNGEVHRSLCKNGSFDAEAYDEARAARYERREGFY